MKLNLLKKLIKKKNDTNNTILVHNHDALQKAKEASKRMEDDLKILESKLEYMEHGNSEKR